MVTVEPKTVNGKVRTVIPLQLLGYFYLMGDLDACQDQSGLGRRAV
ncbi:hypothetical protein [Nonomuraea recticatena]